MNLPWNRLPLPNHHLPLPRNHLPWTHLPLPRNHLPRRHQIRATFPSTQTPSTQIPNATYHLKALTMMSLWSIAPLSETPQARKIQAKALYLNVRGLDIHKIGRMNRILSEHRTSPCIFFLAEHWFQNISVLSQSASFIVSSTRPATERETGHQNGGLAALVHPRWRDQISIVEASEFYISLRFMNVVFTAVYFPPRLCDREINDLLTQIPVCDVILGDVNVRYGKALKDSQTQNSSRGKVIARQTLQRGMRHIPARNGPSRNDHVFSKLAFEWTYRTDLEQNTDHGCIFGIFQAHGHLNRGVSTKRFEYRHLQEPRLRLYIQADWDTLFQATQHRITQTASRLIQNSVLTWSERLELVNTVYEFLMDAVIALASKHLPEYDPEEVVTRRDRSLELSETASNEDIIRAFKRSQRVRQLATQIIASDDTTSVVEEAFTKMRDLFKDDDKTQYHGQTGRLDQPFLFDTDKVAKAIKSYSNTKTGGPDRIHTRFIKCLTGSNDFLQSLTNLFNLFSLAGATPSAWNESNILLIPKSRDNPSLNNTRPITLTNILRRIYERLMLREIENNHDEDPMRSWCRLNHGQAGFRRGYSCTSQILLSDQLSKLGKKISVFLDLKSAYDRVSHTKLFTILRRRGCPGYLMDLFYSLMVHEAKSTVTVNRIQSERMLKRERGLQQGSVLSPFLFNLYIDDLASNLNEGHEVPRALLYADDIELKAMTVAEMRQMLRVCEEWAVEHKMEWGIAKCGVVGINEDFLLQDSTLPKLSRYKYLGVPHGENGVDWMEHTRIRKLKERNFLTATDDLARSWPISSRLVIYRTFARSIGEFCMAPARLWATRRGGNVKEEWEREIKNAHTQGMQWLTRERGQLTVAESLLGIGSSNERLDLLEASLAKHVKALDPEQPLMVLKRRMGLMETRNQDAILHMTTSSRLLSRYERYVQTAEHPKTLSSWYKEDWIRRQPTQESLLLKVVGDRNRSGVDKALVLPSAEIKELALKWRLNKCSQVYGMY
jgi:Reverse transcriptase (RNA-dependent DNA polymerase)